MGKVNHELAIKECSMSGKKSIGLFNGKGKPTNTHHRYKHVEREVFRAIRLAMSGASTVQIWNLAVGKELAVVRREDNAVILRVR